MKRSEHESECLEKLGKPFAEVHKWLDQFAGRPECGMRHRKKLHHKAGIELARELFGDEGAEAAKLHILADLSDEMGFGELNISEEMIPRDEKHYLEIGLF